MFKKQEANSLYAFALKLGSYIVFLKSPELLHPSFLDKDSQE